MFNKIRDKLNNQISSHRADRASAPLVPGNHPLRDAAVPEYNGLPSTRNIFRHRKQYGVNLGAMFVGERWISDRLYSACDQKFSSELSAVQSYVKKHGVQAAQQEWESHWSTWFAETDAAYLAHHGINTVRLPLGYFSLSDEEVLQQTDFASVGGVYANCWHFVERVIRLCADKGIGVLLDLHALPGGQNGDAHAGTDSKAQNFYSDTRSRAQALRAVQVLIQKSVVHENVVGVQVINEPSWGKEDFLVPFYTQCLEDAAKSGNIPIYIGDCWNLGYWAQWAGQRNEFCIVDHHYYYCFSDNHHRLSQRQHIEQIQSSRELQEYARHARGNIVVGEWSLAIDQSSKDLAGPAEDANRNRAEFGKVQLETYTAQCGGAFFWTYKFQVRNNCNEWDLRDMLDFGSLPSPVQAPINVPTPQELDAQFVKISTRKLQEHINYWSQYADKGQVYEHWRYEEGFQRGWNDALAFARLNSRIGYLGEWQKKRRQGHVKQGGESGNVWEFDSGFTAGVEALISVT